MNFDVLSRIFPAKPIGKENGRGAAGGSTRRARVYNRPGERSAIRFLFLDVSKALILSHCPGWFSRQPDQSFPELDGSQMMPWPSLPSSLAI